MLLMLLCRFFPCWIWNPSDTLRDSNWAIVALLEESHWLISNRSHCIQARMTWWADWIWWQFIKVWSMAEFVWLIWSFSCKERALKRSSYFWITWFSSKQPIDAGTLHSKHHSCSYLWNKKSSIHKRIFLKSESYISSTVFDILHIGQSNFLSSVAELATNDWNGNK